MAHQGSSDLSPPQLPTAPFPPPWLSRWQPHSLLSSHQTRQALSHLRAFALAVRSTLSCPPHPSTPSQATSAVVPRYHPISFLHSSWSSAVVTSIHVFAASFPTRDNISMSSGTCSVLSPPCHQGPMQYLAYSHTELNKYLSSE